MAKRILHALQLDKIAAVDRPCQEGASVVIMKRDDSEDVDKREFSDKQRQHLAGTGAAMPGGGFPIQNKGDLSNAIRAIGRAKNPTAARAHIISRAKSLGATGMLPDSWKVSKQEDTTDEDISDEDVAKSEDDLEPVVIKQLERIGKKHALARLQMIKTKLFGLRKRAHVVTKVPKPRKASPAPKSRASAAPKPKATPSKPAAASSDGGTKTVTTTTTIA